MKKKFKIPALMGLFIFVLLLLPIIYLSFVNRATGDDYHYGILTRAAWMGSHSLAAVIKAACKTVKQFYYSWQGTWFSIFVFALQPEVFHDGAYVLVVFMMLLLWIGSTFYLFDRVLRKNIGLDKWSYLLVTVLFLIISIEFIPGTKSAIFWFNGCAHYLLPFAMCQILTAWLIQYSGEYRKRTFLGIVIFMTLLGGSNYLAALFALIVTCYTGIAVWFLKKDKRILTLAIPVILELIGLAISMKSPGNQLRVEEDVNEAGTEAALAFGAGEEFGFSAIRGIKTIGYSFLTGITDIGRYMKEKPLVFAGLLLLFLIFLAVFCYRDELFCFQHPVWLSLMLFCLHCAMYAPSIYAGVPVSKGVPNTEYQVFLLCFSGIMLMVAERLAGLLKKKKEDGTDKKTLQVILVSGFLLCLILTFLGRSNVKSSTSYVSLIYITSGQAADFKEQMDLQTKLMEDAGTEDVIVPFINDVQGPLMHMPVTADSSRFTNRATARFYGKNSVIAMDRPTWEEEYGISDE